MAHRDRPLAASDERSSRGSASGLVMAGAESHDLWSDHVGDTFRVMVAPCGTASEPPRASLIISDADGFFGTAVEVVRSLQLMSMIGPVLVVGVGYPGAAGIGDTIQVRARDLTPTASPMFPRSGGGPSFARFLDDELARWLDVRWPGASAHRTFFGHSLGGQFGFHLLLSTNPFDAYILGSPSIWWDDYALRGLEANRARGGESLPATVFTAIGAHETQRGRELEAAALDVGHPAKPDPGRPLDMVADLDQFVGTLRGRSHAGLELSHEVIADEFHVTVGPTVLSRGLRRVLASS